MGDKIDKKNIEKIAIVTYNKIGMGQYNNGILRKDNKEIHIAQNTYRYKWAGIGKPTPKGDAKKTRLRKDTTKKVTNQINLWDMDKIYLYVGSIGGEEAIRQTENILQTKITYVMCGCNYEEKKEMINLAGNKEARVIICECGGRETLEIILKKMLEEKNGIQKN